jgi:hypothetical protein
MADSDLAELTLDDPPPAPCAVGGTRPLSVGEIALASSVFGAAIDYAKVTIVRRKWFPLQPRRVTMAPRGHLHFHPDSPAYCDDFTRASLPTQAHFIHEMTHVWQVQTRGAWFLITRRPFSRRYDYSLKPGLKLAQYGIEQQAEIVRHAFLLGHGVEVAGAPPLAQYLSILPFRPSKRGANHAA